jgi:excisionase family DNA binding protein
MHSTLGTLVTFPSRRERGQRLSKSCRRNTAFPLFRFSFVASFWSSHALSAGEGDTPCDFGRPEHLRRPVGGSLQARLNQRPQPLRKIDSNEVQHMFNIEVKFKILGREVSWDRFVAAFFTEALRSSFDEIRSQFSPAPSPVSPHPAEPHILKAEPTVVNINEAARLLGIRPSTISAYVSRRKISSVRIGRRVLIPLDAINALLAQGLTPAVSTR